MRVPFFASLVATLTIVALPASAGPNPSPSGFSPPDSIVGNSLYGGQYTAPPRGIEINPGTPSAFNNAGVPAGNTAIFGGITR